MVGLGLTLPLAFALPHRTIIAVIDVGPSRPLHKYILVWFQHWTSYIDLRLPEALTCFDESTQEWWAPYSIVDDINIGCPSGQTRQLDYDIAQL